jgi:para-nitrobenzyl esterase
MRNVAVALALMLCGCASAEPGAAAKAPSPEPLASLAGTTWKLVQFEAPDKVVTPPNLDRYTITFAADGALALQLDCNRANGRWTLGAGGGALALSGGAMTRAMCGPGALDTQIAGDLGRVRSYAVTGGRLRLVLEGDAGSYLWEPAVP